MKFSKHEGSHKSQHRSAFDGLHKYTTECLTKLLSDFSGRSEPISIIIDSQRTKLVKENREKLKSIIESIFFLGRNGLSFRGHRDDSKYHPDIGEFGTGQVGLFVNLLNFRVRSGDSVLKNHIETSSKNASYISKSTQNDLISCCGTVITQHIVEGVKVAKFFSIIADEACDSSNKEQMSLVLRFVDGSFTIREEFIGFLHCSEGLSGKALSSIILRKLNELKIDIAHCRGQGYDGAGAVAATALA